MSGWQFVGESTALWVHARVLGEGPAGVNLHTLRQALASPEQFAHYTPGATAAEVAAATVYALARGHAFTDANKRTAWVCGRLFLLRHGHALRAETEDALRVMQAVASGVFDRALLAMWMDKRLGGG